MCIGKQYTLKLIDQCPECHNLLEPYVRTKFDAKNNQQWFQRCPFCHAMYLMDEEAKK